MTGARRHAPVICVALGVERRALRAARTAVLRVGMGPRRAAATFRASGGLGGRPVLVAGVGGGLRADVHPGDVVVATEVRGPDGSVRQCPSAPLLAAELRRFGLVTHLGPIASERRVAGRAARARLAATGALAVDTESIWLAPTQAPYAVVRVVVDTPEAPLLRPGTAARGLRALRTLRVAAPALDAWAAATGPREVRLANPRSFCAGVERAIDVVDRALDRFGAPVHVRRQIVHNTHVVRELEAKGAVFVEEVDEVPPGSVLVFAAHGVSPAVRAEAEARGLRVVDATCPLVTKVHTEVRRHSAREATVFLIGHADHEEVEGTLGEAPADVVVVEDVAAAGRVVPRDAGNVAYAMQTTLAVDEATAIADVLRARFPEIQAPKSDDICYATTNRQSAVRDIAAGCDLVLVVGSTNSSNSLRLVEVAQREGVPARLVDHAADVDLSMLVGVRLVGVTAGASAPPTLVDELVDCLGGLGPLSVVEPATDPEVLRFTLPKEVS
ncbi:4-hydroxy-3-methylbut-2-enyl diphosphate reductase [Asanoa sp. NPDC050611]|uniref:4-hydroxy-3-methylbut-2-enyl diphosphate reductase n=1 Tax=Asanoa sp. NPDC050611 TaxID=3157098 RepID=UPI0034048AFF